MASLRFNYEGEKRPERGRGSFNPYAVRSLGFPFYGRPMPYPEPQRAEESENDAVIPEPEAEVKRVPAERQEDTGQKEQRDQKEHPAAVSEGELEKRQAVMEPKGEAAKEETEAVIPDEPAGTAKTASEKLVGKLEAFETGLMSAMSQLNQGKLFFDEVIYKIESFQQILNILKANEERKTSGKEVQVTMEKTSRDSIDDFLELLQTPAFQNVLRQLLLGIIK